MTESSDEASRAYYDAFSRRYDTGRELGYHRLIDELELRVAEPYARGKRVLEAGCGTGLILERLCAVASEARGVDLSAGMLSKARARGLSTVRASLTQLPFVDASFDLVCSFKVLPHVQEIETAMGELTRVTAPGGHVIAEFYNPVSVRYIVKRLAGPQPISETRTEADVYTRWDSTRAIDRLLAAACPRVEKVAVYGGRVFTPVAALYRIRPLARILSTLERAALSSPLYRFGGFLIVVLRKPCE